MSNNKVRNTLIIVLIILVCGISFAFYNVLKPGWKQSEEGMKYKSPQTKEFLVGLHEIEGNLYIFGEDNFLEYGWVNYENNRYYANEDGKLVKDEVEIDGKLYKFDPVNAALLSGWVQKDDGRYYYDEDGVLLTGIQNIEDKLYKFKENGKQVIGIDSTNGKDQLFIESGTIKGLNKYNDKLYFVDDNYNLFSGMKEIDNNLYAFNKDTYEMQTGWYEVNSKKYYFNPQDGKAVSGWHTINNKKYYFNSDKTVASGIKEIDNNLYAFNKDTYEMQTGWYEVNSKKYYFNPQGGKAVSGWHTINNQKYYFNSDKTVANGAININNKKYYFESGKQVSGWKTVNGKRYYYLNEGGVHTGNQTIDGKSYVFLSDGSLADGWVTINGKKFYYKDNVKVTSPTQIGGKMYYFNSDGTITTGWATVDGKKYYKNSYGANATGWQTIGGKRYYFDNNGVMATNTTIGMYTIDGNGVATKEKANASNLGGYLDDLLNKYGRSLTGAANATKATLRYKYMSSLGSTQANAIYAINNGKGACYQFASLNYELVRRMGYSANYIVGINGRTGNKHAWISVNTSDGVYYYDALYGSKGYTEAQLRGLGYRW